MIRIENTVFINADQMQFIIQGMRNPWDKNDSDSEIKYESWHDMSGGKYEIGPNDYDLMQHLSMAGPDHRKFMRMMPVYVQITAPLYWWKEFDTYKVGTVANSCNTIHKIADKKFEWDDFSFEHLINSSRDKINIIIDDLNFYRDIYLNWNEQDSWVKRAFNYDKKQVWYQMIQLLPSAYNQRRTVMLNYEVLLNIYKSYKNHKLDEWRDFCKWIESLPYSEVIIGIQNEDTNLSQSIKEQEMINVYGQLIPKKDIEKHGDYNNAVFNGEK